MRRIFGSTLLALSLAAMACATAGENPDGGADDGDGGIDLTVDADPNAPDADPNAPDANEASGDPDAANTCPADPCHLVEQCGCTSPEVCDLDANDLANGATRCRDVLTPGTEENTCVDAEDCAGGYVCVSGACRKYCEDDEDCSGPGGICLVQLQFGEPAMDIPGAVVCTVACTPTLATGNGCPQNYGCHLYVYDPDGTPDSGDEVDLTDCDPAPASGGTEGASCSANSDCQPSLDCINVGGVNECRYTCNMNSPSCPTGTCQAFTDPPVIGGVEYGVCN